MKHRSPISDALRRLSVVVGCAVLATAQPMSSYAAEAAKEVPKPDTILYPSGAPDRPRTEDSIPSPGNVQYLLVAIILAGAGAWILWKKRQGGLHSKTLPGSKLAIEETRSLGNRQYLVVASYGRRKFLLGVTTDHIELLTHLSEDADEESLP